MFYSKLPPLRVHLFGYIFSPRLIPSIAVVVLLSILISLGRWQLHRAAEKKALEQDFLQQNTVIAIDNISNQQEKTLRYRTLQAKGWFDPNRLILLDNKIYKQHIGYHVFSPFYVSGSKKILLVDRGFVAKTELKAVPTPAATKTISGLIYFPGKTFLLKKESEIERWPLVVQAIKIDDLQKRLHAPLYPFYLLLQEGDQANLIRDWHPVNFPSYRHTGYAIQWFLLAFTLLVIYLILNTSRTRK